MLTKADGRVFATGKATYLDQEQSLGGQVAKLLVQVKFQTMPPVLALLDTGAAWSVIDREVAIRLGLLDEEGEPISIQTRFGTIAGRLVRVDIEFPAEHGQSLELNSTVFVSSEWNHGTFLGYAGLLERVKFGVDPQDNSFYFGSFD